MTAVNFYNGIFVGLQFYFSVTGQGVGGRSTLDPQSHTTHQSIVENEEDKSNGVDKIRRNPLTVLQ